VSIASPFEILDSRRLREWSFIPLSFEVGETTIKTAEAQDGKIVGVLRVQVDRATKPHAPYYWDVTSKTLLPELRSILPGAISGKRRVTVRAIGYGVETRFAVEVSAPAT
jgi:hypothetical protein